MNMWGESRFAYLEASEGQSDTGNTHFNVGTKAPALQAGVRVAADRPDPDADAKLRAMETALASDAQPVTTETLEARINNLTDKAGKIAAIKAAHDATGTAIKDLAQQITAAENKFKDLKNSSAGSKDLKLRMLDKNFPVLYGNLKALEENYTNEGYAVIAVGHPRNPESSFDGNVKAFLQYHNAITPALEKANSDLKQVIAMNNDAAEKLQAQAKVSAVVAKI